MITLFLIYCLLSFVYFIIVKSKDHSAMNYDTDNSTPEARERNWKGSDDDNWLMRWRIGVKHWFCFANRSPKGLSASIILFPGLLVLPFTIWFTEWSWWYLFPFLIVPGLRQWRERPITVFAIRGEGWFRLENADDMEEGVDFRQVIWCQKAEGYADRQLCLSRNQTHCNWHFAIQFPFLISWHIGRGYEPPTDSGVIANPVTIMPTWNMYLGWHWDGDIMYWGFGGYAGTEWK